MTLKLKAKHNPRWLAVLKQRERLEKLRKKYPDMPAMCPVDQIPETDKDWGTSRLLADFPGFDESGTLSGMISEEPFALVMFYASNGLYPLPEMMQWMVEAWQEYIDAAGAKTLEDVFFGGPVPGVGNYAARAANKWPEFEQSTEFQKLVFEDGLSLERAAGGVVDKFELDIDPSSLLKKFRSRPWFARVSYRLAKQGRETET